MQLNKDAHFDFKEQVIIAFLSIVIGVFTAWDLFVDSVQGIHVGHLILEGLIVFCCLTIFIRIGVLLLNKEKEKNKQIQTELNNEIQLMKHETLKLRNDNKKYRESSQKLLNGVGIIIDKQFEEWRLSSSEKEVALFLLKGLSHKEIAEIRNTSEKTIRHQSGQIYAKSHLEGRAQLSAFFLEDLLLPKQES